MSLKRLLLALLLMNTICMKSQERIPFSLQTDVDTTIATIGDRVTLKISMNYPKGARIRLPELESRYDGVEVIDHRLSKPEKIAGGFRQRWDIRFALFDTGMVCLPSLKILASLAEDTLNPLTFTTDSIYINVISVLPPDATEPKDIKPPFPVRMPFPLNILIFALLVSLLVIGGVIYYKRWRKANPIPMLDEKFIDPPHIVAFNRLKELKSREYQTVEEQREFYYSVSEIVREYIERRYFIRALEMTTEEIKDALSVAEIEEVIYRGLIELMLIIDSIKFSNQIPPVDTMKIVWDTAFNFIDRTKKESFLK